MTKKEAVAKLVSLKDRYTLEREVIQALDEVIAYLDKRKNVSEFKKSEYTDDYLELYEEYPVHQRKRDGFVNYMKILSDGKYTHEDLLAAVKKYTNFLDKEKGTRQFAVYINNFFGRGDFEDWITNGSKPDKRLMNKEKFIKKMKEKFGDDIFDSLNGQMMLARFEEREREDR